jgi:tetratricopeptide (TPR) repeat protein
MISISRKIILIYILFVFFQVYSDENLLKYYKLGLRYEEQGKIKEAVENYKIFISKSKNKTQVEKIQLKIARISENFEQSVNEYKYFIKSNPFSRYRFLAMFELATLYKFNKKTNEALKTFYKLADISNGTPYWQKSYLEASALEYEGKNYKQAIKNIYKVLEEIEDYEDVGTSYFLLGVITSRQKLYDDAQDFFLICSGSFPQCSKAASSLLELIKIKIIKEKKLEAKKIALMIDQLYTDSPENHEAKKLTQDILIQKNSELPDVELLNLNDNQEIKKKAITRLIEDLGLSLELQEEKKNETRTASSGYYVQLGYYSSLDNANQVLELSQDKNIKDVFITKSVSSKSSKTFYRALIGPYNTSKDANNKLIELKEKNVEAIVLELSKDYE